MWLSNSRRTGRATEPSCCTCSDERHGREHQRPSVRIRPRPTHSPDLAASYFRVSDILSGRLLFLKTPSKHRPRSGFESRASPPVCRNCEISSSSVARVLKSLVSMWKNRGQASTNMCVLPVLYYIHSPKKTGTVWRSLVHFATSNKSLEKNSFWVSYLHALSLFISQLTPILMRRQKITSQFVANLHRPGTVRGSWVPLLQQKPWTQETLTCLWAWGQTQVLGNPHCFYNRPAAPRLVHYVKSASILWPRGIIPEVNNDVISDVTG